MPVIVDARVRQKTDTLANWMANPLIILEGEMALIVNDDGALVNIRMGDGTKPFADLPDFIEYAANLVVNTIAPGGTLPTPGTPAKITFLKTGTYNKPGGGTLVVPDSNIGIAYWDGTTWTLTNQPVTADFASYLTITSFEAQTPFDNYAPHISDLYLVNGFTSFSGGFDNDGHETGVFGYNRGVGFTLSSQSKSYPVVSPFAIGSQIYVGFYMRNIAPYTGTVTAILQFYDSTGAEKTLERVTFTKVDNGDGTITFTANKIIPAAVFFWSIRVSMPGQNPASTFMYTEMSKFIVSTAPINFTRKTVQKLYNTAGISMTEIPFCYVSGSGDDTNSGSSSSPVKTVPRAISKVGGKGTVILKDDITVDATISWKGVTDLTIKAENNKLARLIFGYSQAAATLMSGSTKVYSIAMAIPPGGRTDPAFLQYVWLWQFDIPDPRTAIAVNKRHPTDKGRPNRLMSTRMFYKSNVLALEDTTDGLPYWYWSTGVLYFTIKSGSSLTANPVYLPASHNSQISNISMFSGGSGIEKIKLIGFECWFADIDHSYTDFTSHDISVFACIRGGNILPGNSVGYTHYNPEYAGCTNGAGNGGDGANVTATGVTASSTRFPKVSSGKWFNPWGHDNFDDCHSPHSFCEENIYGGLFECSQNGYTPASGAHASLHGTYIRDCTLNGLSSIGDPLDGGSNTSVYANGVIVENCGSNNYICSPSASMMLVNVISKDAGINNFTGPINNINPKTI